MNNLKTRLSADARTASINLDATLDAPGVEALMRKLALLRARMRPDVPHMHGQDTVLIPEENPALTTAALRDGGVRLWLRHRGYGWLAWKLDESRAVGMARYIASRCVATDGQAIEFIGDQIARKH